MVRARRHRWVGLLCAAAAAGGCLFGGTPSEDAGTPADAGAELDAGLDSGVSDSGAPDAGHDAGVDAGTPDSGADAGADAGQPDGGASDAGHDAGVDAGCPTDCIAPYLSVTAPDAGDYLVGAFEVKGVAQDQSGGALVVVAIDNAAQSRMWAQGNYSARIDVEPFDAGPHVLQVSASDDAGNVSTVEMGIETHPVTRPLCPTGKWQMTYWRNTGLVGAPVFSRCEIGPVDFDWADAGPEGLGDQDMFSLQWLGTFTFAPGSYDFTTVTDDGVRLWVDDVLIIDDWVIRPVATRAATLNLSAGPHMLRLDYFESYQTAICKLSWAGPH